MKPQFPHSQPPVPNMQIYMRTYTPIPMHTHTHHLLPGVSWLTSPVLQAIVCVSTYFLLWSWVCVCVFVSGGIWKPSSQLCHCGCASDMRVSVCVQDERYLPLVLETRSFLVMKMYLIVETLCKCYIVFVLFQMYFSPSDFFYVGCR